MKLFHRIHRCCHSMKHRWLTKRMSKKLALDNQQQQQLMALSQQVANIKNTTHCCEGPERYELIDLLAANTPDTDKLKEMFQAKIDAFTQQGMEIINSYRRFFDNLGPHQQQLLRAQLQRCGRSSCCHC